MAVPSTVAMFRQHVECTLYNLGPVARFKRSQTWLPMTWHRMSMQELADSSGCYTAVPSQTTVDFMSKQRSDGLQYRVGIHHVRTSRIRRLSILVFGHS